jgi:hypothetical protein
MSGLDSEYRYILSSIQLSASRPFHFYFDHACLAIIEDRSEREREREREREGGREGERSDGKIGPGILFERGSTAARKYERSKIGNAKLAIRAHARPSPSTRLFNAPVTSRYVESEAETSFREVDGEIREKRSGAAMNP